MIYIFLLIFFILFAVNVYTAFKRFSFYEVVFHPISIVSFYFLIFFFLPALPSDPYIPSGLGDFSFTRSQVWYVLTLVCVVYAAITVYFVKTRGDLLYKYMPKLEGFNERKVLLETYLLVYCFVALGVAVYLIVWFGGLASVLRDYPSFFKNSIDGMSSFLYVLRALQVFPAAYLLLKKEINWKFFVFLLVFVSIFGITFLGGRILVVAVSLQVFLALIVRRMISFRNFVLLGIFFASLFLFVSVIRSTSVEVFQGMVNQQTQQTIPLSERFLERFATYFERNNDQLVNAIAVIDRVDKGEISFQYGRTLIDAVHFLLPHAIYPKKPPSTYPSRLIYGEVAIESGQRFNFGIIGRAYLDFGVPGTIIIGLLTFIVFSEIYNWLLQAKLRVTGSFSIIYLVLVFIYSNVLYTHSVGANSHIVSYLLLFGTFTYVFFAAYPVFNLAIVRLTRLSKVSLNNG